MTEFDLEKLSHELWNKKLDIDYIKSHIRKLMGSLSFYESKSYGSPHACRLFRARLYPDKKFNKENGITLDSLSYPKNPGKNRLNREGKEIFYCSSDPDLLVFELDCRPNNELIISEWKTKREFWAQNIGFGENVYPSQNEADKAGKQLLNKLFTRKLENKKKDHWQYHPTIAITETLLDPIEIPEHVPLPKGLEEGKFAGVIYPSVQTPPGRRVDNLALEPWFVDNHMEWINAIHCKIVAGPELGHCLVDDLDFSNELSESRKLIWKGRQPIITEGNYTSGWKFDYN